MTKQFLSLVLFAFLFYSCSSAGQMQTETPESDSENSTPVEETVAPWYDHSNKAFSDTLEFTGLGMALAADSSEAMTVSMDQARENIKYAVDSYAENIRRQMTEGESDHELNSSSFLLSLRAAVNGLRFSDSDLTVTTEYSARNNGSVVAYSMIKISKGMAIDMLGSAIENDSFSRSLSNSAAK